MRVLIVEDEVRLAATLQDLMELDGYAADVCHDGESGLDNALSGIYDVVILDVMLPKMDGFSVLRQLRASGSAVPVLMLNQKQVITKESLLLKIWGYESDAEDNNVEVYISFLRKKLDHLHSQVRIKTIRMVGYCLEFPKD